MNVAELERRKHELVSRYGPWIAHNIHLGNGLYTIERGAVGLAEIKLRRVVQAVLDLTEKPSSALRILDLGSHEGLYGIEFARQGASVVQIEGREPHVMKARFVKDALGLTNLDIRHEDVRALDRAVHGTFDVVLCLGILYHLDVPDVFTFVERVSDVCGRYAVIDTQVGLIGQRSAEHGGRTYWGRSYPEHLKAPGASIGNLESFWFTRPSLLNLLSDVGFTSVSLSLVPSAPGMDEFVDHVMLLAVRGKPVVLKSTPDVNGPAEPWPEETARRAHPIQGDSVEAGVETDVAGWRASWLKRRKGAASDQDRRS